MKRVLCFLVTFAMLFSSATTAMAAQGNVTYTGKAGQIVFAPGNDLFPNFKDVMPGDRLTQSITVRNDASNEVKVQIYIRSLGAQPGSEEFLNQLALTVEAVPGPMDYMFASTADKTAQLTNWVCLGTLYSGGEVDLKVTLDVPVTMGNEFQGQTGYLTWQFKIQEFPVEIDDPTPPQTGDDTQPVILGVSMAVSVAGIWFLILLAKKKKKEDPQVA